MRVLLFAVVIGLVGGPAHAEDVVVPNELDGQLRFYNPGLLRDENLPSLGVSATHPAARGYAVFPVGSLPAEYGTATIHFTFSTSRTCTFDVAFYGSDEPAFAWDFDAADPLAHLGQVEAVSVTHGLVQIECTQPLRDMVAADRSYVVAKFYMPVGADPEACVIDSNEADGYTGPRLVFSGAVPAENASLGGIKALFR